MAIVYKAPSEPKHCARNSSKIPTSLTNKWPGQQWSSQRRNSTWAFIEPTFGSNDGRLLRGDYQEKDIKKFGPSRCTVI